MQKEIDGQAFFDLRSRYGMFSYLDEKLPKKKRKVRHIKEISSAG